MKSRRHLIPIIVREAEVERKHAPVFDESAEGNIVSPAGEKVSSQ